MFNNCCLVIYVDLARTRKVFIFTVYGNASLQVTWGHRISTGQPGCQLIGNKLMGNTCASLPSWIHLLHPPSPPLPPLPHNPFKALFILPSSNTAPYHATIINNFFSTMNLTSLCLLIEKFSKELASHQNLLTDVICASHSNRFFWVFW